MFNPDDFKPGQVVPMKIEDYNNLVSSGSATMSHWIGELTKLEKKRIAMHHYIDMKLDERDYHAVADAAMDLRELDARSNAIKEWVDGGSK